VKPKRAWWLFNQFRYVAHLGAQAVLVDGYNRYCMAFVKEMFELCQAIALD
jgi:hypothetical protein